MHSGHGVRCLPPTRTLPQSTAIPRSSGRDEHAATRGDGARVVSVVLPDARPTGQKMISSLQAEISAGEQGVSFKSLGKTFNFVNEVPLHATAKKCTASSRIYHDDVIRLGGDLDEVLSEAL